jgi:hypothetical protein
MDGNKPLEILVPVEITEPPFEGKSTADFKKFVRKNPEAVKPGTYICIPTGRFGQRVTISRSMQTKII